jgi:hypothetical protein
MDPLELLKRPVPDFLYHYTSIDGLRGIIESRSIWASMIHYLNDKAELTEALQLCGTILKRLLKETPNLGTKATDYFDLWRETLQDFDELHQQHKVCVFSFSEQRDLLSQWRGYCPPDGGYVLGFRTSTLKAYLEKQGFILVPCIYDETEQKEVLSQWIAPTVSEAIKIAQEMATLVSNAPEYNTNSVEYQRVNKECEKLYTLLCETVDRGFFNDFHRIAPAIKNKGFSEEQEWRAISNQNPRLSFRTNRSMLVPYCNIDLNIPDFPIEKFIVGPGPNQILAADSLRQFLLSKGIAMTITIPPLVPGGLWGCGEDAIELSTIPFRRL